MRFPLGESSITGEIRQGELLGDVWVHRTIGPASEIHGAVPPDVEQQHHPVVVVLHSDCDLLQDYNARKAASNADQDFSLNNPAAISAVLLCDAFLPDEIHERVPGRDFRKRVSQNQDQRYHTLEFEPIRIGDIDIGELVLDFRKFFTVDTESLYTAIESAKVSRIGVIPPIYIHDLMHRGFGYMSRVALP